MTTRNQTKTVLTLAAFVSLAVAATAVPASAAVIQPDSVTGPEFDSRFLIEYMRDGTGLSGVGDILTQTHHIGTDIVGGNGDWLVANSGVTVVFDLGGSFDVDAVHLWQYTDPSDVFNAFGTKSFELSFFDGIAYGPTIASGDFIIGQKGVGGEEGVQTKSFAVQAGVTQIKLTNFVEFGGGNVGAAEMRFGTAEMVPEPSTLVLTVMCMVGLGLAMVRRHRKRS